MAGSSFSRIAFLLFIIGTLVSIINFHYVNSTELSAPDNNSNRLLKEKNKKEPKAKGWKKDKKNSKNSRDSDPTEEESDDSEEESNNSMRNSKAKKGEADKEAKGKGEKKNKNAQDTSEMTAEDFNDAEAYEEVETFTPSDMTRRLFATGTDAFGNPTYDSYPAEIPFLSNITDAFMTAAKTFMNRGANFKDMYSQFPVPMPALFNETTVANYADNFQKMAQPLQKMKAGSANTTMDFFSNMTDHMNTAYGKYFPYGSQYTFGEKMNMTKNAFNTIESEFMDAMKYYMTDMDTAFNDFWTNFTEFARSNQQAFTENKANYFNQKNQFYNDYTTTMPADTQPMRFSSEQMQTFFDSFKQSMNETMQAMFDYTEGFFYKVKSTTTSTTAPTTASTGATIPIVNPGAAINNMRYYFSPEDFFQKFNASDFLNKFQAPSSKHLRATQGMPVFSNQQRATEGLASLLALFEEAKPQFAQYFEDFKASEKGNEIMKQFNSSEFSNFFDTMMTDKKASANEFGSMVQMFKNNFQNIFGSFFDTTFASKTTAQV